MLRLTLTLNRLDGVNDAHVGCCTEYGYDAVGNLQSQSYPNGIASAYQYDLLNRLTNLTTLNGSSGLVAKYSYTVAPSGHRLTASENVIITNTVHTINRIYSYDAMCRLINEGLSVTGPVSLPASANVGYTLDDVGNRLSRTTTGFSAGTLASATSTYDANDRLKTTTPTTPTEIPPPATFLRAAVRCTTFTMSPGGSKPATLRREIHNSFLVCFKEWLAAS